MKEKGEIKFYPPYPLKYGSFEKREFLTLKVTNDGVLLHIEITTNENVSYVEIMK